MRNYTLSAVVIFFLMSSCVKRVEEPKDLLSKEQIRDILIEAGLSKNIPNNLLDTIVRNTENKADKRILSILKEEAITLETFKTSHRYYTMYPEEYKMIFKMVKDSLNKELNQLKLEDSIETKKTKKPESPKKEEKKKPTVEELKKIDQQKKNSIMKPK